MCAIAGILNLNHTVISAGETLPKMLAAQQHRGPDGLAEFSDGPVALGHARLAILDLTDAGRQPMTSRDGRWTIVFNGEIFNYRELRDTFDSNHLKSATDTEVLLETCAAGGVESAMKQAAGMFAFALWDRREGELTLVRDRFGEKPLVYFWDGQTFAFASEMKALACLHQSKLHAPAVDAYLALGYVPAPLAIFRNCHKLPAGHLLRIDTKWANAKPEITRWWTPEKIIKENSSRRGERIADLRAHMRQAVEQRLRADVPIALSLSGGVDSSVIAAECARLGNKPFAFTVRFDGDESDLPYARSVAQTFGLKHEVLDANAREASLDLGRVMEHYDEPFADSSALAAYTLARSLAGRYKVILNGDGGDEVFGGYCHYERIAPKQFLKQTAARLGMIDGTGPSIYVESKSLFRAEERSRLLGSFWEGNALKQISAALSRSSEYSDRCSPLKNAMAIDLSLPLANALNFKTDIAFGAFGIEGRAPFLDHRLIGWAQSLPEREFVNGSEKKVLLRAAYADQLPASVLNRPKHGFGAPLGAWLKSSLGERVRECIPCSLLDKQEQRGQSGQRLWTLLAFSEWARMARASW